MKKLLVIGQTFPEPGTTAAGARMLQLLQLMADDGFAITFASTATATENSAPLKTMGISTVPIILNDSSFDFFVKKLNPTMVLFDRFICEEQFGWRIAEQCPHALRILDTEDLHFLRKAREEAVKTGKKISDANLYSETTKRELASILRSDLSLIISEYEMQLLQHKFGISGHLLHYLPFLVENSALPQNSFALRKNFLAIGNLLHAPNIDSVRQLKEIWPQIRRRLPDAQLHVYGAYAPQHIRQLHNKKEGFMIMGRAENLEVTLGQYRLQLAPLRFGAGLKGKLVDAMRCGLPSITTEVGAEGLGGTHTFGGNVASSFPEFVQAAVEMYSDENQWQRAQAKGYLLVENRFRRENFLEEFKEKINCLVTDLGKHRENNFIGQILQHQSLQASKYLSKWIEAKNRISPNASPVCFANSEEVRDEYRE